MISRSSRRFLPRASLMVAAALLGTAPTAQAANITWTGATNDTWSATTSWIGGVAPSSADDLTILGPGNTPGALTINITAGAGANSINITDTEAVTVSNTTSGANQTLTIGAGGLTTGTGSVTIGSATANQGVNIALGANQTWNIGSGGLTANNVISGTGFGITKTGAGTLTLSGANTYTGATTVSAGTLVLSNTSSSPTLSVASGSVAELRGATTFANAFTLSGTGTIRLSGTGSYNFGAGAGTISLGSGALIELQSGVFNGGSSTNKNYANNLADLSVSAGANFGTSNVAVRVDAISGGGTIDASSGSTGGSFTFGADNGSGTFSGKLTTSSTNKFPFNKLGSGTQVLSGVSDYASTLNINAGTLQLNTATGSLGPSGGLTLGGGIFNIDNTGATGALAKSTGTLTFSAGDGVTQIARTAAFDQAFTFSSLAARAAGATGNFVNAGGTNSATNGFVLTGRAAGFIDRGFYFGGSAYAWYDAGGFVRAIAYGTDTGAVTSGATPTLAAATHQRITGAVSSQSTAVFSTLNIAGNHNLTLAATQTLTFDGILKSGNTAGGATISGGTGIQAASGAELVIRTDGANDTLTISNVILANGASSLTKSGAGTLVLNNTANTYTGRTTVNGGTLRVANADTALGAAPVAASPGQLTLNGGAVQFTGATSLIANRGISLGPAGGRFDTQANNVSVGGIIAGSGTLTKLGSGTLTLTGTSTYTGATIISEGKLALASNLMASSQAILIGNGATLESTGGFNLAANQSVTGTGTTGTVTTTTGTGLITTSGTTLSTSGTLTITRVSVLGTGNSFTGGTVNSGTATSRGLLVGNGGTSVFVMTGGTWNSLGTSAQADILGNQAAGNGTLIVNGGQYFNTAGNGITILGNGSGGGTLTITSGSAAINTLTYSAATTGANTSAIVNLDGGTLTLSRITVTGGATKELNFNGGQFVAGADIPAFTGLTLNVKNGGARINTNGFSFAISDPLLNFNNASTSTLVKTGAGTLTLSGNNTYVGGTNVSAGALSIASAAALPGWDTAGRYSVSNGATLAVYNAFTDSDIATMIATANFSAGAALGFDTTSGARAYAPVVADTSRGALGLTKLGANTLTLSGVNTYTGATTISGGALSVSTIGNGGVAGNLGQATASAANLTLAGGTLQYTGATASTDRAFTLAAGSSGTIEVFAGDTNLTFSAASASTTGALTKTGLGTLTLSGANTYTGITTINGGTLVANTVADSLSSSIGLSQLANALTFGSTGGTLSFTGTGGLTKRAITFTGAAIINVANGADLTIGTATATPTATDGAWLGAGGVTKAGEGALTVLNNGDATYNIRFVVDRAHGGDFTMQAGVLNISPSRYMTIGDSAVGNFYQTGGTANFTSVTTPDDLYVANGTGTGLMQISGGTFTLGNSTRTIRVGGGTGAGTLTVGGGPGTATLDANQVSLNTTAGAAASGTLNLRTNGVLFVNSLVDGAVNGTSTVNFDGGTLKAKSGSAAFMPAGFNSATITVNGFTLDSNGFDVTVGQALDGLGALTKRGNGVLTLSGANTFSGGVTVASGTLRVGNSTALGDSAGAVSVSAGAVLDLNGVAMAAANALTLNGTGIDNGGALTNSSATTVTYAGLLSLGSDSSIIASAGDIVLSAAGTITGAGFGLIVNGPKNLTLAANLGTGAGSLTKSGNGVLTLSGANTHSGGTTLNAGTLNLNNASALGNGAFTLNGGILDNTGATDVVFTTVNAQAWNADVVFTGTRSLDLGAGAVTLSANRQVTVGANTLTVGGSIAGAFGLTKAGTGSLNLGGASTYSGATAINAGTLRLTGSGAINGSIGVNVNNANLIQNSSVPLTAPVTLTQGSVGGLGAITSLTVADLAANAVNAGAGSIGTLSVDTLEFGGAAKVNFTANGTSVSLLQLGTLKVADGKVITLNITDVPVGAWVTADYPLIDYTTLDGTGLSGFTLGTVAGSTSRTNSLLLTDSLAKTVTLRIESYVPVWTGADDGRWVAGATGANNNWKLPSAPGAPITDYISGDAVRFDDSATTRAVLINDADVTPASVLFDNSASFDYTLSGTKGIVGTGGLTKKGAGTLTIGTLNTYAGTTLIEGGSVILGAAGTLGASTAPLTLSGGRLDIGTKIISVGAVTITAAPSGGAEAISAGVGGTLTASSYAVGNTSDDVIVSASLRGAGGLTKNGAGALTLLKNNDYAGATVINGGLVKVEGTGTLGGSTSPLTLGGGSLDLRTGSQTVGAVSITTAPASGQTISNGTLTAASFAVSNGADTSVILSAGLASAAGALTKSGAGSLTLSGVNTYAGGTTLNAGTLNIATSSALGTGTFTISGGTLDNTSGAALSLSSNNTQAWNGNFVFTGSSDLNLGTGAVTMGSSRLVTINANTLTVGGAIGGGTVSLTKAGSGMITLSGASAFSGGMILSAGVLRATTNAAALGAGTLTLGGGELQLANDTALNFGRSTTITSSSTITADRLVSGAGLTHTLGSLSIGAQTLTVSKGANIATGDAGVTFGATTLTGAATFSVGNGASLTFGALAGNFNFTKQGGGTLTLTATSSRNASAVTYLNGGTLVITADNQLTSTPASFQSGSIVFDGGTLGLNGGNLITHANRGILINGGGGTLSGPTGNNYGFAGRIEGTGDLTVAGTGQYITGSSAHTYSGATILSLGTATVAQSTSSLTGGSLSSGPFGVGTLKLRGGSLRVSNAGGPYTIANDISFEADTTIAASGLAFEMSGRLTLTGNRTITQSSANDVTISGVIGDGGNTFGLSKTGTGRVILSGANTFTGGLTIGAGILQIGSDGALNSTVGAENAVVFGASSTGTLRINGRSVVIRSLASDATAVTPIVENENASSVRLTIGNSVNASGIFAGVIRNGTLGGTLALTKSGNGTLTLSGANTYTGGTNIDGGTLIVDAADVAGVSGALGNTGDIRFGGGLLRFGGAAAAADYSTRIKNSSSAVRIDTNAQNVTFAGGIDATNTGGLVKSGAGVLVLSGANTYTGGTTISAGTLQVGNGSTTGTLGSGTINNDSSIVFNRSDSFAVGNMITGSGSLTKSGVGTLALSGESTYSGATTVNNGALRLSGSGSLNSSIGITVDGTDATLEQNSSVRLSAPVTLTRGSVGGTGTVGTLNIAALATNRVNPGSGGSGILTVDDLTFAGAARLSFNSDGTSVSNRLTVGTLTTTGANSLTVEINGVATGAWGNNTYLLINYGTLSGSGYAGFDQTVNLSGATRRTTSLLLNDIVAKTISLQVSNEKVRWSGLDAGGNWTVGPTGANKNWKLSPSNTATDYFELGAEADAVVFDDTAAGTTNVNISGSSYVQPTSVVFDNSLLDYTLGSLDGVGIAGTGGLTKNGTRTLTITAANLYSGATIINEGKIILAGFGMLGEGAPLSISGGQLDLGGSEQTLAAVSISRAATTGVTVDNGSLKASSYTISNSTGNVIINANLGGSTNPTFTKTGSGMVTLSQASSFSGGAVIAGGTLTLSGLGSLGSGSSLSLSGGALDLGTNSHAVGAVSITAAAAAGATIGNGTLTGTSYAVSNTAGTALVSANLGGASSAFTKTGAGTVTLSGANTFTGMVSINGGVLSANTIADSVSSSIGLSLAANTALSFGATGGTLRFTGVSGTTRRSIAFNGPATFDIADGASLAVGTTAAAPTATDGAWSGAGSITKSGDGTLTIRNTSTLYSNRFTVDGERGGNFFMQAGTLNVAPTQYFAIGESGVAGVFTQTGGTVNFTPGSAVAGNDVFIGNTTVAGQLIVTGGRFNVTSDALQIRVGQNSAGTLSIGGGAGIATVDSPMVSLGLVNGTGNGVLNLLANGVLLTSALRDGGGSGTSTVNLDGGTLRAKSASGASFMPTGFNTAAITANGLTVDSNGFDVTIGQALGGAGGLTKAGNGILTLSATNTYAGATTITAGTLTLGNATNTLANGAAVNVNGGTLNLGTNNDTVGTVTLTSGTISGTTGVLTSSANYDVRDGAVSVILGGAIGLNKSASGTVTLSGANSFTGATSVTNGTLRLSGSGHINSSSGISVNGSGAKFFQSSSVAVSKAITLTQGTVTGSGTVNTVNVGAGTGGVISNNDGVGGAALTIGTLTLAGGASLNLFSDGANTAAPLIVTTLTNNASAGAVTLAANNLAGWTNGVVYSILDYGTQTGGLSADFTRVVNNKSARQNATWADDATNGLITLTLTGDSPRWVGDTNGSWNTTTDNNWLLINQGGYVRFLATDEVIFDDNATGVTTVVIDQADVTPNETLFANGTKNYVLSGAYGISTGSLTKTGAGTLTIGTANTYSGATTLNGGSVILIGAGRLGSGSALTLGGSSLDLGTTTQSVGAVSITAAASSGATIANGSLTGTSYSVSNASGTAVISANLLANGSAGFVKNGAGAVTLSGANTFTGGFTLNAGTVNLNAAGALGAGAFTLAGGVLDNTSGSAVTLTNSGAQAWNTDLTFTGTNDLGLGSGTVTLSANRTVNVGGSTLTVGGNVNGGAFTLTKTGAGTLVLGGSNTFTGVTTVQNGALRLAASPLASVSVTLGNNTDSGKLILGGTAGAVNQTLTVLQTAGTGTANAVVGGASSVSTLTLNVTGTLTYAGGLGGSGTNENNLALIKLGNGVLTLSGAGTFTGSTTVSAGVLTIANKDALAGTSEINVATAGATLRIEVPDATSTQTGAGRIAAIVGNGLNVYGALVGADSISTTWAGKVRLTGNAISRIGGGSGGTLTVADVISGEGATSGVLVSRAPNSTTIFAASNTYTGETQFFPSGSTVTLKMGIANAISTGSRVLIASTTTGTAYFDLNGYNQSIRALSDTVGGDLVVTNSSVTADAELKLNFGDNQTFNGWIQDGATRKTSLVISGSDAQVSVAGNQTLSGANTYTGGTWVQNGTLTLSGGDNRLATNGSVRLGDVSTTGRLVLGGAGTALGQTLAGLTASGQGGSVVGASNTVSTLTLNIVSGTNTFGGAIGGAGTNENNLTLTKTGNGVLALTNTGSTYTGVTTVNGGTLRVASLGTTGASSVGSSDRAVATNLALNGQVRLEYAGTGETASRSFRVSGSGVTLASSGSGAIEFTSSANVAFATDGASARELRLAGSNAGDNTFSASAAGTPAAADVFRKIVKNEVGKWVIAGSGTLADNLQVEVNAGLLAFAQAGLMRSGSATVNGGTLVVSSGTNTSASVTINNGGTLGGSASLGAVTVNNGGALSPGSSPGIFNSSSLTLAGGSIINWQVLDGLGSAGIGYDQLAVTGNLDLRGASATNKIVIKISSVTAQDVNGEPLNFGAPNGVSSIRTFQFGQVGGLLQTNGENISDLFRFDVTDFTYTGGAASNAGLWSISWNAGAITLTAVPEPSTYGLGLGALALAAAALRRRRQTHKS